VSEVQRIAIELERTIDELGQDAWARDPEWCRARVAEFYDGGIEAFGATGPNEHALREAQLWFLLDCPLPDGDTPLWHLQQERAERSIELLSRSEVRAWRIESAAPGPLTAVCSHGGGRSRLELGRAPSGELRSGALAVGRSVPLGPALWLLLGGVAVVDPAAAGEFERLVASLEAPPGEFWRVHGGVLARAACEWGRGGLRAAA
jgi:hypothetical protein